MGVLTTDQQAVYDAVMEQLSGGASAVENLSRVSAVGNEDTSLPVVTSNGQLVTILIGTLVALSAQNLSQSLALWAGPASPSTVPGSSPYNKVYLACESGSYSNFLDEAGHVITLEDGEVALIRRKATYWEKETLALLNKAFALAAAENANDAADAVLAWFGEDDSHGIRKTWSDWFSNSLSTGVRKVWTTWFGASASAGVQKTWSDWFEDIKSSWRAWFGATSSAGIRKTWSDWFGASDSAGVRKVWSDWFTPVQSDWSDWFSDTLVTGIRKVWSSWFASVQYDWSTWFSAASSDFNSSVSAALTAANAASNEAQGLSALKRDCLNATGAANAAAQSANEARSSVEDAVRALSGEASTVPVRMEVYLLDSISLKNTVPQKVGVKLYPTYIHQNVLFQKVSGTSVMVNPSGDIAVLGTGQTVYWVVPSGNISLWRQVTVNVRGPRMRLTSTGKIRLNSGKIRIV